MEFPRLMDILAPVRETASAPHPDRLRVFNGITRQPLKLEDFSGVSLTSRQAFLAMGKFLLAYYARTKGRGNLATICADVQIETDRGSVDPAALSDWVACVGQVLGGRWHDDEQEA
jgi:hypothetical protein